MMRKYIYIIGIGAFLSGCSNDAILPEADIDRTPITFTAGASADAQARTRAAGSAFPNGGSIAIVAATSNSEAAPTNWSSPYFNTSATVGTEGEAGKHPVTFTPTQYWPFSTSEYLGFIAYSPATNPALSYDNGTVTVSADGAGKNFPDMLYAPAPTTAYNKTTGKSGVDLGTFQHAMAKLVIKVIPIDKDYKIIDNYKNENLKITELSIHTKVVTGTFNLLTTDWTLTAPANDATYTKVYTLIGSDETQGLPYESDNTTKGGSSTEYYLFPETSAVATPALSKIVLKLQDGNIPTGDEDGHLISTFKEGNLPVSGSAASVKLEMGKTTTLTFYVKTMNISTGDTGAIILKGELTDWKYKGNSTVEIQ